MNSHFRNTYVSMKSLYILARLALPSHQNHKPTTTCPKLVISTLLLVIMMRLDDLCWRNGLASLDFHLSFDRLESLLNGHAFSTMSSEVVQVPEMRLLKYQDWLGFVIVGRYIPAYPLKLRDVGMVAHKGLA